MLCNTSTSTTTFASHYQSRHFPYLRAQPSHIRNHAYLEGMAFAICQNSQLNLKKELCLKEYRTGDSLLQSQISNIITIHSTNDSLYIELDDIME